MHTGSSYAQNPSSSTLSSSEEDASVSASKQIYYKEKNVCQLSTDSEGTEIYTGHCSLLFCSFSVSSTRERREEREKEDGKQRKAADHLTSCQA